jgi:uncharacterized membrane protein
MKQPGWSDFVFWKRVPSTGSLRKLAAKRLSSIDRYDLVTVVAILIYAVVFSWFMIWRNYGFATFAWDLGVFNQSFYTTIFNGKFLYSTCELYLNPTGSYFASKFSPIILSLLPFYAVHPSPETLLILKSVLLSLGAVPLYLLSTQMLGSKKTGFIVVLAYLLSPGLQSSSTFDFQQQVFIPITIFSVYYFMIKKQWKLYFMSVLLSLMIEEHVAVIIFLISLVKFVTKSRVTYAIQMVKKLRLSKPSSTGSILLATMATSVVWYFISRGIRQTYPIVPQFSEVYRATDTFRVLGFTGDILSLPTYILMNPQRTITALSFDIHLKFLYSLFLLAPLLFLSLRSRLIFVVAILLAPFFLSNYAPYYMLGAHYPLYVLPIVFLAALEGLRNHTFRTKESTSGTDSAEHYHDLRPVLRSIIIVSLVIIVCISPLSPLSEGFMKSPPLLWYAQRYPSENFINTLHGMINMVPTEASVLTQNNIFPHFSNRINAYVIPIINAASESENKSLTDYVKQLINLSDYVLLDSVGLGTEPWTNYVVDTLLNSSDFNVYAIGGPAILFKKGFKGSSVFVPNADYEIFVGYSDFIVTNSQIVDDETSNSGSVAFYQNGTTQTTFFYGPYLFLPPGKFEVSFEIKFGEHGDGYLGTLDVSENFGGNILSKRDIYGFESIAKSWTNYTVDLSSTKLRRTIEFRMFTKGTVDIYLDRVIVKRISDKADTDFGTKTYSRQDLLVDNSTLSNGGFLIHRRGLTDIIAWYGPYVNLPAGNYTSTFFLKTSMPSPSFEKSLTIDVAELYGQIRLIAKDILSTDLLNFPNTTGWHSFTLEFTTLSPITFVEFRGLDPSPNLDIYLGFILVERIS